MTTITYVIFKTGCYKAVYNSINEIVYGISIKKTSKKYDPKDYNFDNCDAYIETIG